MDLPENSQLFHSNLRRYNERLIELIQNDVWRRV